MKITCPECSVRFDISSDMVGKKAKCGECAHVFVVPDVGEKKAKKEKSDTHDVRQAGWLSLYLAGIALGMLIFRGNQGGMIATMLFGLAIETAALFLAWRGFWNAWALKDSDTEVNLIKTAILVNGILLALLLLSMLLTLCALVAGQSAGGLGNLGGLGSGLGDFMKNVNEINKLTK